MIRFIDLSQDTPYSILEQKYNKALDAGQKNIDAVSISSYNPKKNEVDSRFVNLKFINKEEFIFFTNYNSPKSQAFMLNNQIAALIYWPSINIQIRLKSFIKKTSEDYNRDYFKQRSAEKNALAISSDQSAAISSFDDVIRKYEDVKENHDLFDCPDYWGGYSFIPYYFEFWEGHESRLNKREVFNKTDGIWKHSFLQP